MEKSKDRRVQEKIFPGPSSSKEPTSAVPAAGCHLLNIIFSSSMARPPPETRPAAVSNSPSVMMNFMMGSTEARFKGSFFEGSAEQHHEEEAQHFSLKVGRYHTFVAGLYAKIIGYRDGIQADSSVVTFYEVECLKEGKEYTMKALLKFSFHQRRAAGGWIGIPVSKITASKCSKDGNSQNSEQSAMRMNMINAWLASCVNPYHICKAQVDSFFEVHACGRL